MSRWAPITYRPSDPAWPAIYACAACRRIHTAADAAEWCCRCRHEGCDSDAVGRYPEQRCREHGAAMAAARRAADLARARTWRVVYGHRGPVHDLVSGRFAEDWEDLVERWLVDGAERGRTPIIVPCDVHRSRAPDLAEVVSEAWWNSDDGADDDPAWMVRDALDAVTRMLTDLAPDEWHPRTGQRVPWWIPAGWSE